MKIEKKTIDSRLACVMAEIIMEDNLPIHLDIGRSSGGCTDILLSYLPEDEEIYLKLIDCILEPLYSL